MAFMQPRRNSSLPRDAFRVGTSAAWSQTEEIRVILPNGGISRKILLFGTVPGHSTVDSRQCLKLITRIHVGRVGHDWESVA